MLIADSAPEPLSCLGMHEYEETKTFALNCSNPASEETHEYSGEVDLSILPDEDGELPGVAESYTFEIMSVQATAQMESDHDEVTFDITSADHNWHCPEEDDRKVRAGPFFFQLQLDDDENQLTDTMECDSYDAALDGEQNLICTSIEESPFECTLTIDE